MNSKIKRIFSILLCLLIFSTSLSAFAYESYYITVYSPEGESAVIYTVQLPAYEAIGWSTSPFVTLYSPSGDQLRVPEHETASYIEAGWYLYPVTTIYSPEGQRINVSSNEVENYLSVGWYLYPVTRLYSAAGETLIVHPEEVETYTNLGWSTQFNATMVTLYSEDGRTVSVFEKDVNSYLSVGWHEAVTVYRDTDNATEEMTISPFELSSYLAEGWRTHRNARFAAIKTLYDKYLAVPDYSAALALISYYKNTGEFAGTDCEAEFNALYDETYNLWSTTNSSPIGFVGTGVSAMPNAYAVSISLHNLSDKNITYFEVEYTLYDKALIPVHSYRAPVEMLFEANTLRGFTWSFPLEYNVSSAANIRISKAIFEDGTVWSAY